LRKGDPFPGIAGRAGQALPRLSELVRVGRGMERLAYHGGLRVAGSFGTALATPVKDPPVQLAPFSYRPYLIFPPPRTTTYGSHPRDTLSDRVMPPPGPPEASWFHLCRNVPDRICPAKTSNDSRPGCGWLRRSATCESVLVCAQPASCVPILSPGNLIAHCHGNRINAIDTHDAHRDRSPPAVRVA